MKEILAGAFSLHHIFVDYYDDAEAAESVEQIEDWCKRLLDETFVDKEVREGRPDCYLMYQIAQETEPEKLPEALAHSNKWVRDLACKRYIHLTTLWNYTTWYIDVWNWMFSDNGETHGTVMAMCAKSNKLELHRLGHKIWGTLEEMHKGDVRFDT